MPASDERIVDFPTLGFLVADWVSAHPYPFVHDTEQLWDLACRARIEDGRVTGDLTPECRGMRAPVTFAGWAEDGDVFHCLDHGCPPRFLLRVRRW